MLHRYCKFQSQNVRLFGYVYQNTNGLHHGPAWKTQLFLLKGICTVILWQDYYGKGNLRKSYWSMLGESSKLGMSLCTSWKRIVLICVCEWHTIGWKDTNIHPMWKELMKEIDLGEPTSFLDHVHLGCTQRECHISKDIVDNYQNMFESRISVGAVESYLILRNLAQTFLHGPLICKVMQRNARNDIANWRTEQPSNFSKSQLHALTTINSKKTERDLLENCLKYALKIDLKCL